LLRSEFAEKNLCAAAKIIKTSKVMTPNEITEKIISASIKIHRTLGAGLFESVYEEVLYYELTTYTDFKVERQKGIPVYYDNLKMDIGFRADLIVENQVIVELKSVEKVMDVHKKQLLTYLKLTNLKVGLLINFNDVLLKNGITRIVNNF
jgi:GxxExxY protein